MANGKIKGITVEIGGDTTKLGKAIADSEKHTRSLQTELRQVEKLLKFDPTNTELLAQKQKILTDAINETAKKLDTLKDAEADVVAQFERGEIAEDQLRAFQREIMQTEKDLNGMKSELSSTEKAIKDLADGVDSAEKHTKEYKQSIQDAKEELSEFKEKASEAFDTVKTGATVLGGAMVAGAGYALKLSTDFDKAFNTLITKTGASADEMESLNEAMENVYANNFGESIEDVANAMATVKQNIKLSGDALQSTTEHAILLRDTFDFDINESTRTAKMLMDQYGMSADEAYNLIVQGAQNGLDKNGDLLDTINEYSVHFNQLGFDADEMFQALIGGAESGTFSVDKLGDAVKEFGIRAKDGSKASTEAFEILGYDADEAFKIFNEGGESARELTLEMIAQLTSMDDSVEKTTAGVGLFGTMWEDLGSQGIEGLLNGIESELDLTKDALGAINEQKYDDIGSAIQGLGRTLDTELIDPLGDELKPVVEDAIGYVQENGPQIKKILSDVVKSVGDFVGFVVDNGDAILSVITGIGVGMLAWNVASIINSVVGAIKAYQLANEGATIAQALFNAVLNANPLMLIVTLITAVIVAIVTFIATNEEARQKIAEVWTAIKQFFLDAWTSITNTWSNAKTYFLEIWSSIKQTFSEVRSWFSSTFSGAWQAVKNAFSNWSSFFGGLWDTIKNKFTKIGTQMANAISKAVKAGINGVISSIESTINRGISLINGAIRLANKLPGVNVGTISHISFPRLAKGGIVDRATLAEIGEDGAEAIVPLENNTEWIKLVARGLRDQLPVNTTDNTALLEKLDGIYDRLNRLQIVLDTGTLVGETIDKIDSGLANRQLLSARGV